MDNNKWIPWMQRAIQLASLGDGKTSPNPKVGAIVLDENGSLIGEGYHKKSGDSHAEVGALKQAGELAKGGTLVVSLEPCCHHGKTPPCTDLIIEKGISRVVIALMDPDSRVSGKGALILKNNGIEVIEGVLEKEAAFQNRDYIHRIKTGKPWGVLKWAMSFDGRIALPNGESKWISSEQSRKNVYQIRANCDAVIVGGETVRSDNPLLTSRGISNPEPTRIVFTRSLNLPKEAIIWDTQEAETIVAFPGSANLNLISFLPKEVKRLQILEPRADTLLKNLALQGFNRVMWECGPKLATLAVKQNCVQELILFVCPAILGGTSAMTPLSEFSFETMNDVLRIENFKMDYSGKDLLLRMLLK